MSGSTIAVSTMSGGGVECFFDEGDADLPPLPWLGFFAGPVPAGGGDVARLRAGRLTVLVPVLLLVLVKCV